MDTKEKEAKQKIKFYTNIILFAVFVFIIVLSSIPFSNVFQKNQYNIKIGDISPDRIIVPYDFKYFDKESTEQKKIIALLNLMPEFYMKKNIEKDFLDKTAKLEKKLFSQVLNDKNKNLKNLTDTEKKFLDFNLIQAREVLNNINEIAKQILEKGLIENYNEVKNMIKASNKIKLIIQDKSYDHTVIKDIDYLNDIVPYQNLLEYLKNKLKKNHFTDKENEVILNYLINNIKPNLFFDKAKFKNQKKIFLTAVKPVYKNFKKGDIIAEKGEIITGEALKIINYLKTQKQQIKFKIVFGWLILVSLIFYTYYLFLYYLKKEVLYNFRLLMTLFFLILLAILSTKLLLIQAARLPGILYLIPLPAVIILLNLIYRKFLTLFTLVIFVILLSVILYPNIDSIIVVFIGTLYTILKLYKVKKRNELIKIGMNIGIVQAIAALGVILLFSQNIEIQDFFSEIVLAFSNGFILTPVIVLGLTQFIEDMSKEVSDFTLLELSDINAPLLRKLQLEAPGTYQHSLTVATIAESAAEEIKSNSLLVRVGAYYHDIGKLKMPHYFAENEKFLLKETNGKSSHEKIKPTLSVSILKAHVRNGVEIAKENRLPKVIIDFIEQHHGETIMKYFYYKALNESKEISEEEFRYPGPKPQTKETAILMLADSIEAAINSVEKLTPSKIEEIIETIFKEKIEENQLDESNLSLAEIKTLKEKLIRIVSVLKPWRPNYEEVLNNDNKSDKKEN